MSFSRSTPSVPWLPLAIAALVIALGLSVPTAALAQEGPTSSSDRQKPPETLTGGSSIRVNYFNEDMEKVVKFFMDLRGENYIIGDSAAFKEKITIVSQEPVSRAAAWQAFLSALEVSGYTLVRTGRYYKVIKAPEAIQYPLPVRAGEGDSIPYSDQVITQLLPLDSVAVADVQNVVNSLKSRHGNVIVYNPTNTLIITDHAYNVRKIWEIVNELDVGSPKSSMEIIKLRFADATEVQSLIEQLYGVGDSAAQNQAADNNTTRRRRRTRRRNDEAAAATPAAAVSAGKAAKYIDKVMSDQRTNSLIVLANEEGMKAVYDLLDKIDVDATDNSRSQIHVVRLEQAKAQDVVDVLSRLSEGGGGSTTRTTTRTTSRTATNPRTAASARAGAATGGNDSFGAIAAFDSGMRIAHDESTNSLVIIASPEDYRVVKQVIDELDRVRKQVFVDAVILEISSDDNLDFGMGVHAPQVAGDIADFDPTTDEIGFIGGQLGADSTSGLATAISDGLSMGVFGPSISIPNALGEDLSVPAFGVVLQAIKTYTGAEVVSNPNLLTLDNAEAKISVGRKVPFPTNTSITNFGPTVTFTREDVAVALELTPRINSENYVTLEVRVEVSEVEPSDSDQSALQSGGPVTSKREVETTALVKNNQTVVLGGLVGTTETEVETKVPILGDVPLIGALFRGRRVESRRSNLVVFLTPHIVEDSDDMTEIMEIKDAQFREFRRRFYGKSREKAFEEIRNLLAYSMNVVGRESYYRGSDGSTANDTILSAGDEAGTSTEYGRDGEPYQPEGLPVAVPPEDQPPVTPEDPTPEVP